MLLSEHLLCFSFFKKDTPSPYNYTLSLLLLPPTGQLASLGDQPSMAETDLLQGMWQLGMLSEPKEEKGVTLQ